MTKKWMLVTILLLMGLALGACAPEEPVAPPAEEEEEAPPSEEEEEPAAEALPEEETVEAPEAIEVGATIPLTGAFAGGGAQVQNGYVFAVDDINAAGGIYVAEYDAQIPINLTILDDESDPTKVVDNLETLYADQEVTAYLGPFGSGLHAAAAAIAEKNQVPYLGVAFALYDIHQQGYQYLFSPFWKSPQVAEQPFLLLEDLVPSDERPERVAIFEHNDDWGDELGALWEEAAAEHGYEVVVHEEYAPGAEDVSAMILAAQEADAQVVLALPTPPDGVTIYRTMAELGYTPAVSFFMRAPDPPPVWSELGASGDYVLFGPGWANTVDYPGVDSLNERHIEEVGRPADPIVGPAYAAVQILAIAIERAGTLDRDAVRTALAGTDLDTVAGHITFNEDGTADVGSPIPQWQSGVQEIVWPPEIATADFVYPATPFGER